MKNERQFAKIKKWFIDNVQDTARSYQCYIDVYSRNEETDAIEADENGYLTVLVDEVLAETEKAVKVNLSTGSVVGSYKGWATWVPKSVIAEITSGSRKHPHCDEVTAVGVIRGN